MHKMDKETRAYSIALAGMLVIFGAAGLSACGDDNDLPEDNVGPSPADAEGYPGSWSDMTDPITGVELRCHSHEPNSRWVQQDRICYVVTTTTTTTTSEF